MYVARIRFGSLAFLAALAVTFALSAPAGATPSKPFSLVICALGSSENCTASPNAPAAVPVGGTSVAMTATFTNKNNPSSGIRLGSVNLTPPNGFAVSNATVPPSCSGCTATVVNNVVQLRSLSLQPGESVMVSMTVDDTKATGCLVPNQVPNPTNSKCAWSTEVKQSNDFSGLPGNDLTLDPGTSAPYTVLAHLSFGTQPHSAGLGQVITGSDFNPAGPPVTTNVVDANGTTVGSYRGKVDLTLNQGTTPQGGTVAGSTSGGSAGALAGAATFPNLAVSAPGNGYTFTASAAGLPPNTTSTAFDIAQAGEPCGSSKACATLDALSNDWPQPNGIDAKASTNASANDANLAESVDFGTKLTPDLCEGYQATHDAWFDVSAPGGGNSNRAVTASITTTQLSGNITGSMINGQDDCLETINKPFTEHVEGTNTTGPALKTVLPNGVTIYTGLLADCGTKAGQVDQGTNPCVSSRTGKSSKLGNGTLTITISVPAGFGDPTHSG